MNNLDYGIIGNCRTAALVSEDASIDWCCLPEFDSASVFAKILDEKFGGHFGFIVDDSYKITQTYVRKTCILRTTFESEDAAFEVLDFLPRYHKNDMNFHAPPEIIRYLRVKKGTPKLKVDFQPKLEYAKGNTLKYLKNNFIVSIIEEDEDFGFIVVNETTGQEDAFGKISVKKLEKAIS